MTQNFEISSNESLDIGNNSNFRRGNVRNSEAKTNYSRDSLRNALNIVCKRKCDKIENFLQKTNQSEIRKNLSQLYGFACSSYGLIKDEYRERIWPALAENIPRVSRLKDSSRSKHSSKSSRHSHRASLQIECLSTYENNDSDSDFESALSNFSGSIGTLNDLVDVNEEEEQPDPSMEDLRSHKEWNQVELDVNRTLSRFPPNISEMERGSLQKDLTPLIVRILWENPSFSYYQGFHDVCLTLVLAMNVPKALIVARYLTRRGVFYNYLTTTLEASAMRELENIYVLLYMHDDEVEKYLREADLGTLFALSWPITWFSHDLTHYSQIVIFFDLFLSSHPMMPIYVGAALIAERRKEIFACEQEMPYLHKLLNVIPENINVNRVLNTAQTLFGKFPPNLITGEFRHEYDKMCERQRRQRATFSRLHEQRARAGERKAQKNAQRIPRYQALATPWWFFVGTATGAVALYLWSSRNWLL